MRINGGSRRQKRRPVMETSRSSSPPSKNRQPELEKQSLNKSREMKIRLSREVGITKAIAEKRAAIWQKENEKAIDSSNTYVEKHGCRWKNTGCFNKPSLIPPFSQIPPKTVI